MALVKQPIEINFSKGLDTKTDPFQVQIGKFLSLENSVFNKYGLLTKRNGFGEITTTLSKASYLTTFQGNLTGIGTELQAYAAGSNTWVSKGNIQPLSLSVLSLIRANTTQTQADAAVSSNNFICTVYTDTGSGSTIYKYAVADATTGQNILSPAVIPSSGTITTAPRVFFFNHYFIIGFTTSSALEYVAVNALAPVTPVSSVTISGSMSPSSQINWDAVVMSSNLYFGWNGSDMDGAIRLAYLSPTLVLSSTTVVTGFKATLMSLSADIPNSNLYVTWWDNTDNNGYTMVRNQFLASVLAPTEIITSTVISNITGIVIDNLETVYYELPATYAYDTSIATHYVSSVTCSVSGSIGSPRVVARSVGLASKAFVVDGEEYFLAVYSSPFQPTYFLLNSIGEVISRLAYSNAGGYKTTGLPGVTISDESVTISYEYADLIEAVNKSQGVANAAGVYSQTGVNAVTFTFGTQPISSEIGETLNLTAGFLWSYDGYSPVENNFFLWPDYIEGTPSNTGGSMFPQQYFYQVIYEWMDNQGNINRSAPSIPLSVDMSTGNPSFIQPTALTPTGAATAGQFTIVVSSATGLAVGQIVTDSTTPGNIAAGSYITKIVGTTITLNNAIVDNFSTDTLSITSTCSVVLDIPTLRLTYKLANPVKISIFRWSTGQQNYFEVTSITSPLFNDPTVDYVTFTDTQGDPLILGNALIYTTGGVIEDIGAPSFNSLTLFDDRLWGIDAEDPNLLWFSKQVIETTPVEMSDLFTVYVAPSTSVQGSSGILKCLSPMDDKIILFKSDAIYYINGTGPDNTGSNSQYSQPTFIIGTVGTVLQESIVLVPQGLMFQSDKGIWLLNRQLGTSYIGAPVEDFTTAATVLSAVSVIGTNQVRFTMNSGITLMYDYFFDQWSTFVGIPGISSTTYNALHTYIDSSGRVFQETPSKYLDGSNPVLQSFVTAWVKPNITQGVERSNLLQGYQRAYFMFLLGTYKSPHKLQIGLAYDYDSTITQSTTITPNYYAAPWGVDTPWGGDGAWGGSTDIEEERIFFDKQRCESFQVSVQEIFDPSFGTIAGEGLTLSGLNMVIGVKRPFRTQSAAKSAG